MQTERCCISCYFSLKLLASSVKLKVFLTVTYFINSLLKRKSVKKLTQLSIKISKISYFSVPFCWRGEELIFNRGAGNISKKGGLTRIGGKGKIEGGFVSFKEPMSIIKV